MPERPRNPGLPDTHGTIAPADIWGFLASNIEADPAAGWFRLSGQRLLILRPEALVDLQKQLEGTVGLSSKGFLYLAGEKSATEGHALFGDFLRPRGPDEDEPAVLARSIAPLGLLGLGRFDVAPVDVGAHRYLVTLENSPLAEVYGESRKPVCHLLAGWVAGTARRVLGGNFLCEEMTCRSQGKPRCEFQLRPMPRA